MLKLKILHNSSSLKVTLLDCYNFFIVSDALSPQKIPDIPKSKSPINPVLTQLQNKEYFIIFFNYLV